MDSTSLHLRLMTTADVAIGMRLKEQAGWNQLEGDWLRFLALQPDGCFIAELNGSAVGTAIGFLFGSVSSVAMMLVDTTARGRGVGKALFARTLEFLERNGARTIRLDATDLGRPLYEKFGFRGEYWLRRYVGTLRPADADRSIYDASEAEVTSVASLDRAVTGIDREKLIRRLMLERTEPLRAVRKEESLEGYLTARPGSRALFIGPCIASEEAGLRLFQDAFHRYAERLVYIDILESNSKACALAESHGLNVQRRFLRMRRGEPLPEHVENIWASSGPEKG